MAETSPPRRRRIRLGLAVSASTLLVLSGAVELGARVLIPESAFHILSDVYARDPDPRIGYTYRRSFRGPAFGTQLVTNSLGFRGSEWNQQKDPRTLRIALIGDSHAFGFGVPAEHALGELLCRRLERRLGHPVELLNFGVNGYNSSQELAVLETKALRFAPDLVLLVPCNNDADPALWADADGYLRWDTEGAPGAEPGRILDKRQISFSRFQK